MKTHLAMSVMVLVCSLACAHAQSTGLPTNVPMVAIAGGSFATNDPPPVYLPGTVTQPTLTALAYQSSYNVDPVTGAGITTHGALVDLCWANIEASPGVYTLNYPGTVLFQLAQVLTSTQSLVLGVRGGTCAPAWLAQSAHVPMPTTLLNPHRNCQPMTLPASYNPFYVQRYLNITRVVVDALKNFPLASDATHTLQDRLIAIRNGAMASSTTDEMGIYSSYCRVDGVVKQTQYQVAQIWATLGDNETPANPADDYTPEKAKKAYAQILAGLFKIAPPNVAVSQPILGSDKFGFPLVANDGTPYALARNGKPCIPSADGTTCIKHVPNGPSPDAPPKIVPVFDPIVTAAAKAYRNRIVFAFNELASASAMTADPPQSPPPSLSVFTAAMLGAGVDWQLNGDATINGSQGTSCNGEFDQLAASQSCFAGIVQNGTTLVPQQSNGGVLQWIEFWPQDLSTNATCDDNGVCLPQF